MSKATTGMVRFRLDPDNPPTMSPEQMQALRDLPDSEIDYSDIPPLPSTGWRRVNPLPSPSPDALISEENKQQITLRLDADVLAFFKGTGRRYQSRINAALRAYMLAHKP